MRKLNADQIVDGIRPAAENARELIADAKLLMKHKSYPRAYGLAHVACEELAKLPMLARAGTTLAFGRTVDWDHLGKRLRSHLEKAEIFLGLPELLEYMRPEVPSWAAPDPKKSSRTKAHTVVDLRAKALYSDHDGKTFRKPSELVTKQMAAKMLKRAEYHLEKARFFGRCTKPEVEEAFRRGAKLTNEMFDVADRVAQVLRTTPASRASLRRPSDSVTRSGQVSWDGLRAFAAGICQMRRARRTAAKIESSLGN